MVVVIIVLMLVPAVVGSVLAWRYMRPVRVFESADKGANREIGRALKARELPDATAESWIPRLEQAQDAARAGARSTPGSPRYSWCCSP